ncbi:hypothetical protein CEP54_008922 [Fusarium duplospermum]|uniref:Uncharacterized protein n=1 Tax=Fusarium duplospermum TaxID=1325734 RepID=A0A428PTE3_9HYPO|nr:hypothetical protein CEP54_008922 [Fusarium duplospermum]
MLSLKTRRLDFLWEMDQQLSTPRRLEDHSVDGEKLLAEMELMNKMITGFLLQAIDYGADVWDYRLHSVTAIVLLVTTGAKAANMLRVNEWKDTIDNKCLL